MNRLSRLLPLALLLCIPASAAAQAENPVSASGLMLYETVKNNILRTAEQAPEEDLSFHPTDDVRSLGQLLGHIADAQYMFCSLALGEESPSQQSVEQASLSKDQLLEAVRGSFQYCDRAYALGMDALAAPANVFGQESSRFHAVNINLIHNWEHYGNLVTYERLRGRVPPSSQQQ